MERGPMMTGLLVMVVFLAVALTGTQAVVNETRLIRDLTNPDTYEKLTRPVTNYSDTVRVNFGLALISLYEVNEASGYIITNTWARYIWKDERLTWTPADYGRLDHVRIPSSMLWRPDLVLYNAVNAEKDLIHGDDTLAVVSSDGTVLYIPRITLKSSCSFDLTKFPFDDQWCSLKFGSWTYDGYKVDFDFYDNLKELDITDYIASNEWGLLAHPAKKNTKYYPCCSEPYPDLTFSLHLKRMENFYTEVFIVPGVVMSLLTPCIFILPTTGHHRYVLGAGMLITLAVTLSGFDDLLPKVNSTPVIGRWFCLLEAIVIIALIISAIITNLANRASYGQSPPGIVKKVLVDGLGRVLCIEGGTAKRLLSDSEEGAGGGHGQWETVARILDRLFFFIFSAIIVIFVIICSSA